MNLAIRSLLAVLDPSSLVVREALGVFQIVEVACVHLGSGLDNASEGAPCIVGTRVA